MRFAPLLALLLSACTPTRSGFVRFPVKVDSEHPGGRVLVALPIETIQARLEGFEPGSAAYYFRGRSPLPHALMDQDEDGTPDHVQVSLPEGHAEHWVLVVSPGDPEAQSVPMPPGGSAAGVTIEAP